MSSINFGREAIERLLDLRNQVAAKEVALAILGERFDGLEYRIDEMVKQLRDDRSEERDDIESELNEIRADIAVLKTTVTELQTNARVNAKLVAIVVAVFSVLGTFVAWLWDHVFGKR